ncbi:hypothetical protein CEXT_306221 [Caerostris extrusa]|uniref:Uncharacterized protein n=1 Tax=Caerostris extrusa TaxID=172846 RepID=A0AAV4TAP8_CAEEX|nr:hypothetical protein CEXT_306221 [Caerostris extrusa]
MVPNRASCGRRKRTLKAGNESRGMLLSHRKAYSAHSKKSAVASALLGSTTRHALGIKKNKPRVQCGVKAFKGQNNLVAGIECQSREFRIICSLVYVGGDGHDKSLDKNVNLKAGLETEINKLRIFHMEHIYKCTFEIVVVICECTVARPLWGHWELLKCKISYFLMTDSLKMKMPDIPKHVLCLNTLPVSSRTILPKESQMQSSLLEGRDNAPPVVTPVSE